MGKLEKSYVCGTSAKPLLYETVGENLAKTIARWGDREALVARHQGLRWTYREFGGHVDDFAAGLLALGLNKGDRIGIWAPNCAEWAVTQYAAARAGLILVNVNPAYRRSELEYALNLVGCRALVTAAQFKSSDYIAMIRDLAPEVATATAGKLRAARLPDLEILIRLGSDEAPGFFNFWDVAKLGEPGDYEQLKTLAVELQPDDAMNIQFTSGTTGQPKGATLTHHNVLNNGFFVGEAIRTSHEDRICLPVPLYHCFGMVMGNLNCTSHGACMVYPGEGFDPQLTLATIEAERCTGLYGVPTMFIAELDHPAFKNFDLSSLRTGIMAGAACPTPVMKRVLSDMHMRDVTIAYGMTETSPVSFQSSPDDSLERRVSTIGRIHPHVEVKIVDDEGRVVAPGVRGQLLTRGYSVMLGYWGDAARTAEAIDDAGWMHTGDLATIDAEGYGNIVGRVKDMVIRGGENVYPREIEEFLYRHPKIQDVQVFGVPDKRYGEELCVWMRLREGEKIDHEEIVAFCKGEIAHYKVPRYVKVVDEFPMTVTGKVQKFVMREMMIKELGLDEDKTA